MSFSEQQIKLINKSISGIETGRFQGGAKAVKYCTVFLFILAGIDLIELLNEEYTFWQALDLFHTTILFMFVYLGLDMQAKYSIIVGKLYKKDNNSSESDR